MPSLQLVYICFRHSANAGASLLLPSACLAPITHARMAWHLAGAGASLRLGLPEVHFPPYLPTEKNGPSQVTDTVAALSRLTGAELSLVAVPYYSLADFDSILRSDNRRTFDGLIGASDILAAAQLENLT